MKIANAIYDVTFKYLMENETTARIMLAALLQREVVSAAKKELELTKDARKEKSMLRIDLSAQVRTTDGDVETITIELYKKWLWNVDMRFRRYLGLQHRDDETISTEANRNGFGSPTVAIYILGHTLDDLPQPIVYIKRLNLDPENKERKTRRPSRFADRISHDAIIVQIPRIMQKTQTRQERMMQIFRAKNTHAIEFDDTFAEEDTEMRKVAERLNFALTDSDMRRTMEIEDEILSDFAEIEEEIKQKDEIISQKDETIKILDMKIAIIMLVQNKTTEEIRSLTNLTTEEVETIRSQMQ